MRRKHWTPKRARKLKRWFAEGDKPVQFVADIDYATRTVTMMAATMRQYRAMKRAGWKPPALWPLGIGYFHNPKGRPWSLHGGDPCRAGLGPVDRLERG